MKSIISMTVVCGVAASAMGAGQFAITEIYPGISGPDGTEDWFELTNVGDMAISTDGLFYDDESADIADAGALDVVTVNPGESVVVLLGDTGDVAEFNAVWKADDNNITVITTNGGGGGLSQNGDGIFLLDAMGNVVLSQAFDNGFVLSTIDLVSGSATPSQIGVNGAYASNPFDNDGIDVQLIGSPGLIPTPGAAALLGLGGLAATRRRR